jgi:translation initiation factor IF-1
MSNNDVIEAQGVVLEVLPDSKYRIELNTKHLVLGYLSGRMKKNHISVTVGDEVIIELTPYDLTKGRVIKRLAFQRDDFNPNSKPPVKKYRR